MPFPVLAALAAVKGVAGLIQKGQASRRAARNVRPTANQSDIYESLLMDRQRQAQFGLDPRTLATATQNNNNAFDSGLQAMLQAGGDPNSVSRFYSQFQAGNNDLAVRDEAARWQKVNAVTEATRLLADSNTQDFLYNEDGPYKDNAQLAALQEQQGSQNVFGALDSFAAGYMNENNIQGYGATQGTQGTGTTMTAAQRRRMIRRQNQATDASWGAIA